MSAPPKNTETAKFVLGTVQFGLSYGVANASGKPADPQVSAMLQLAHEKGVRILDTARAYGDSEAVLARCLAATGLEGKFEIVTKVAAHADCEESVAESHRLLKTALAGRDDLMQSGSGNAEGATTTTCLPTVLCHSFSQFRDGKTWAKLQELQKVPAGCGGPVSVGAIGTATKLGVSVYDSDEYAEALATPGVQHVQCPFNVLVGKTFVDIIEQQASSQGGVQASVTTIVLHVRSVYFQGLLLLNPEDWAKKVLPASRFEASADEQNDDEEMQQIHVAARKIVSLLEEKRTKFNRKNLPDLLLAYTRAFDWIDGVVLGVDTVEQLQENLALFETSPLTASEAGEVTVEIGKILIPSRILDPRMWGK
eukprot:g19386.t1